MYEEKKNSNNKSNQAKIFRWISFISTITHKLDHEEEENGKYASNNLVEK